MRNGLCSLNPMDHNWNLIPPIVDLLDGYFEIILLPFFLDIELKDWVPRAPLSSLNLIPISCIKNLDSAIISWTMLFALLANVQCADTSPSFYYSFKLWWIFLFLQLWTCCEQILLYPPSHHHCCGDLPPTMGESVLRWQIRTPLYYHSLAGGPHHPQRNHDIPDYG